MAGTWSQLVLLISGLVRDVVRLVGGGCGSSLRAALLGVGSANCVTADRGSSGAGAGCDPLAMCILAQRLGCGSKPKGASGMRGTHPVHQLGFSPWAVSALL